MNQRKICTACGTQFPVENNLITLCPICEDERQYIPEKGQTWTTHEDLLNDYSVMIDQIRDNLYALKMSPSFAIGQRAFLILSPSWQYFVGLYTAAK